MGAKRSDNETKGINRQRKRRKRTSAQLRRKWRKQKVGATPLSGETSEEKREGMGVRQEKRGPPIIPSYGESKLAVKSKGRKLLLSYEGV